MRLWVVEVRAKERRRAWGIWIPASRVAFWERSGAWALARDMRHVAPSWKRYRVKPWVREGR